MLYDHFLNMVSFKFPYLPKHHNDETMHFSLAVPNRHVEAKQDISFPENTF